MSVNHYAVLDYVGNQHDNWTLPQIAAQAQGGVQGLPHVDQATQQVYQAPYQVYQTSQPVAAHVRGRDQWVHQAPYHVYQAPQTIAAHIRCGDHVVRQAPWTHQAGLVQADQVFQSPYQDYQAQGGGQQVFQSPYQDYQAQGGGQQVFQSPYQDYQAQGGGQQVYQAPHQGYQALQPIAAHVHVGNQGTWQGYQTPQQGLVQAQGGDQKNIYETTTFDSAVDLTIQQFSITFKVRTKLPTEVIYEVLSFVPLIESEHYLFVCRKFAVFFLPRLKIIQALISQRVVHLEWNNYQLWLENCQLRQENYQLRQENYQLRQENTYLNQRINYLDQRIDILTTELQRVTFLYERSDRPVHFTPQELTVLHNEFLINPSPPMAKKQELSDLVKVPVRKITSWFKRQRKLVTKNAY